LKFTPEAVSFWKRTNEKMPLEPPAEHRITVLESRAATGEEAQALIARDVRDIRSGVALIKRDMREMSNENEGAFHQVKEDLASLRTTFQQLNSKLDANHLETLQVLANHGTQLSALREGVDRILALLEKK
jgi:septation ring formation regulator EzrA